MAMTPIQIHSRCRPTHGSLTNLHFAHCESCNPQIEQTIQGSSRKAWIHALRRAIHRLHKSMLCAQHIYDKTGWSMSCHDSSHTTPFHFCVQSALYQYNICNVGDPKLNRRRMDTIYTACNFNYIPTHWARLETGKTWFCWAEGLISSNNRVIPIIAFCTNLLSWSEKWWYT